jgi:hypothetical protein
MEPTGEEWCADVLADPRVRRRSQPGMRGYDLRTKPAFYRLRDELCSTILVARSKCDWKAAFDRDELIAAHGSNIGMVELLRILAARGCSKVGHRWDHRGAYHLSPIDERKGS